MGNTEVHVYSHYKDTEKQLTRKYDDGEIKAVSVISKDVVHLPGNVICQNDILNNPGENILDVLKVQEHIVAVTPYSVFVNMGNGNAHNTKEYKTNYQMISNYHYICSNNKDTIMHAAYDNNIIQFIKIVDDGIKEINVSPFPNNTIVNATAIKYQGGFRWWVFTDNGIYYCKDDSKYLDWELFLDTTTTTLNDFTSTYLCKPIITTFEENSTVYNCVTLVTDDNYFIRVKINISSSSTYAIPESIIKFAIEKPSGATMKQIKETYVQGSNFIFNISYMSRLWTTGSSSTGTMKLGAEFALLHVPTTTNITDTNTKYVRASSNDLFAGKDITITESDTFYLFNPEESSSYVVSYTEGCLGALYHIPYNSNNCNVYYLTIGENNTIEVSDCKYTHSLSSTNFTLIDAEPPSILKIARRDAGDERNNSLKIIYYSSGQMEFYIKNKKCSSMFYTYFDTNGHNITTSYKAYDLRKKKDVTNKLIHNYDYKEYTTTYTPTETTKENDYEGNTIMFSGKGTPGVLPYYVEIRSTQSGNYGYVFPYQERGFVFTNYENTYAYPISVVSPSLTITNTDDAISIKFLFAYSEVSESKKREYDLNIIGEKYTVYAKY